jgi:predicted phage terminase large subunit-like protein
MRDLVPALAGAYSCVIVAAPLNTRCVASTLEKGSDETNPVKACKFPSEARGKPAREAAFPASRLARLKKTIGSLAYAGVPAGSRRAGRADFQRGEHTGPRAAGNKKLSGIRFNCVFSWTDPGVKHGEKHCRKAAVCAGIAGEGTVYVLKARIRKEPVSRMADGMCLARNARNPGRMFHGDSGGQALPAEVPDAKAETGGCRIPRRAETNTVHKDTRIEGTLSAPVENGVIRFCKTGPDRKELTDELLQFPDGEYKDGPDALEGAVRKLREYARKRRAGMPSASRPRESARKRAGIAGV